MSDLQKKRGIASFSLYALSFVLLWEWLRPVQQLTETGHIGTFLGFVFMSLLLSFLGVWNVFAALAKLLYILYSIAKIHYEGAVFNLSWLGLFLKDMQGNVGAVWNAQWPEMSNPFRTLLFFILIWLVTYLIDYWLLNRKRILLFFMMTVVFITVIDTFTAYKADAAILRVVVAGFAILGMLAFFRLAEKERLPSGNLHARKWMIPLAVMIAGSTLIAWSAPKANPIWPDPVPFIQSMNDGSGTEQGGAAKRVGYGSNDSSLGGPFIGDDSLVFTAEMEERHYWKVETKDVYTGKGWVSAKGEHPSHLEFSGETPPPIMSFYGNQGEVLRSTVHNEMDYSHIQYPHGLSKIITDEFYLYRLNRQTGKITSLKDFEPEAPASYTVEYEKPAFRVKDLQDSSIADDDEYALSIINTYTQLPEDLPPEIRELALELTDGLETWYDKAQAVEKYFRNNGFVYDQVDVAIPEEDEDYVAQFLFETKRGYCDNFSTSMTVMLRTLEIPARWVKGYTEGEYFETLESGARVYEVTNNNAHSWVEVYFPEVGWVPFEPTQGFSNNVVFQTEESSEVPEGTEETEETAAPVPLQPERGELEPEAASAAGSQDGWRKSAKSFLAGNWKQFIGAILLLAGTAALAYWKRGKWLPFYYIVLFKMRKKDEHFPAAYLALLSQLERYGLRRRPGQTLREYAWEVDQFFSSRDMRRLTDCYEQFLYRGALAEGTWQKSRGSWEKMIKKAG
jgi:transglutaminase-like putative cysteine protease